MPRVIESSDRFIVVGENIHTTRVVRRNGRRTTTLDDGTEAVLYKDEAGNQAVMTVPESYKSTQPYEQGQIKHFMIAVNKGIGDDPDEQAEGVAYIRAEALRQIAAGADFLDLNVDEISYKLDVQKRAIAWLVNTTEEISSVPLSIDSSNSEIIAAGLAECDGRAGRPMVNSVALERLAALDMVKDHDARAIVTAAGADGMPENAADRVANVDLLLDAVRARGVPLSDVYIDGLVFPISVSSAYGMDYLDAVSELREKYGSEVHIAGGLSNVSFGLPARRLINDTFIYLAIEAGIDSGIVDPVQSPMDRVFGLDVDSEPVKLAREMLIGTDDFCMNFIQAWKAGKLS